MNQRIKTTVTRMLILAIVLGWTGFLAPQSTLGQTERQPGEQAALDQYSEKISAGLRAKLTSSSSGAEIPEIRVIVQVNRDLFNQNYEMRLRRRESRDNMLRLLHAYTARLTVKQIELLLESEWVDYVSEDRPVQLSGTTRGNGVPADFLNTLGITRLHDEGVDGEDSMTVALFDSGIGYHYDLDGRIEAVVDFTSGRPVEIDKDAGSDEYGHGTALAGIIGSLPRSRAYWKGVAPGVKFIDLKVVGPDGYGMTSSVIQAVEWVLAHQDEKKIRVANLSLGAPPQDSYMKDPLAQAARKMVQAGITTVVSDGNFGRTAEHEGIWGGITSPGIEPSVITVGAVNTQGTDTHSDDVATSYSSRGPSIDGFFKPDISAPGNMIPSLAHAGSYIAANYPDLFIEEEHMYLSGSSMATAIVTGTVVLMLNENNHIHPNLIKGVLELTAIKLTQPHMLEQGNGLVNAYTAVKIAKELEVEKKELNHRDVPAFWNLPNGETVWAGGALTLGNQIAYSPLLLFPSSSEVQSWGSGTDWSQFIQSDSILWADSVFIEPFRDDSDGGSESSFGDSGGEDSESTLTLSQANYQNPKQKLQVVVYSSLKADLKVTIDGFVRNKKMKYKGESDGLHKYVYDKRTSQNLDGQALWIVSSNGDEVKGVIQ